MAFEAPHDRVHRYRLDRAVAALTKKLVRFFAPPTPPAPTTLTTTLHTFARTIERLRRPRRTVLRLLLLLRLPRVLLLRWRQLLLRVRLTTVLRLAGCATLLASLLLPMTARARDTLALVPGAGD